MRRELVQVFSSILFDDIMAVNWKILVWVYRNDHSSNVGLFKMITQRKRISIQKDLQQFTSYKILKL